MRPLQAALCVSLGSAFVACDSSDAPIVDDPGSVERASDTREATRTRYFRWRPCPTYSCGFNSPFIGHELNLEGEPNADGISISDVTHFDYEGSVKLSVIGDSLIGHVDGDELIGDALLGLSLHLKAEVEGQTVELTAKLVGVGYEPMWIWDVGQAPEVTSYKFVYETHDIDYQMLCPSPEEGAEPDEEALSFTALQVEAFNEGDFSALLDLNKKNPEASRPYHAVLFSGDRFDLETSEIFDEGNEKWFNIGCKGSSAAKLHLTGNTSAASKNSESIREATFAEKQAALYAFTGTYCPGSPRLTVPGQPLRMADHAGLLERSSPASFEPRASGTVEAIWGPEGIVCLKEMRRYADDPSVLDELEAHCGLPPACPSREEIMEADLGGDLLDVTTPVITFNLSSESCQALPDSCNCDPECETAGTCCEDYVDIFWNSNNYWPHSPCVQGDEMYPSPSRPCVTEICEADSWCCEHGWDQLCVNQVESVCGMSCN